MLPAGPLTIGRPRLARRLASAVAQGHAAVVAPAGYGKTTLTAQALTGEPAVAWHICRAGDREPLRLLDGIARALERAEPGIAGRVLDALSDPGDPVALAGLMADESERLLLDRLVLVVDDGEQLAGAEEALALIDALLSHAGRLRVLVVSRVELGLRSAAAAAMARLTRDELVFDADDAAAFLEARLGRAAADAEVRDLLDRTLGWPLGVGLDAGAGGDPDGLVRELLARVDDETCRRLLESSAVDELTPGVVAALGLDEEVLAAARPLGLAPRPGLSEGGLAWHPLLREALRGLWHRSAPAPERAAVLERAGRALLEEGRVVAGIEALSTAGAHDRALDAVLAHGDRLLRTMPGVIFATLERVPAQRAGDPVPTLLRGWLHAARGHVAASVGPLREGLRGLDALGRDHDGAGARLGLCESLYFLGRLDEAIAEATPLADDPAAPQPQRAIAGAWRALYLAAAGRWEEAQARMGEVLASDATGAASGLIASARPFIEAPVGRHEAAISALDDAHARLAGRSDGRPEYLSSLSAFLAGDLGRRADAVARADRMVSDREPDGLPPFVAALAHALQGWTRAVAGDFDGADIALAQAEAAGPPDGWAYCYAVAARALGAAARGSAAEALAHARESLRMGRTAPDMHFAILAVELASGLLDAGEAAASREIVDELLDRLPAHWTYPRGRALTLRCAALAALGDEWTRDGRALLRTVAPDRLTDVLSVDWRHVRALVWEALGSEALRDPGLRAAALAAVPADDLAAYVEHPVAAVRAAAAGRIARAGHPEAATALDALAGDPDDSVRRAATAAREDLRARPLPLRFTLLGGFTLTRGGWRVPERHWKRPTAARLVRYLLVAGGDPVNEDRVAADLWPDHDGESARAALRMAVSRARGILDDRRDGPSMLVYGDHSYRLELAAGDGVDAWSYTAQAHAALTAEGPQRRLLLRRAERAWGGEPLPEERYAEWARPWREQLEGLRRRVLFALAAEHRRAGDEHEVAEAARTILSIDDTDEAAHRLLITALARTGQRSLALRQYLDCRRRLIDGLGLEPDGETAALQSRLLSGMPV